MSTSFGSMYGLHEHHPDSNSALSDPKWMLILKTEDRRALSPLFHGHINPYGFLSLDMNTRLTIETHRYKEKVA